MSSSYDAYQKMCCIKHNVLRDVGQRARLCNDRCLCRTGGTSRIEGARLFAIAWIWPYSDR
eukprot:7511600-Pyramimonas_sp.AAC.1